MENLSGIKCSVMVAAISDSYGFFILGDTFIRNYYVSFDYAAYTVSIA